MRQHKTNCLQSAAAALSKSSASASATLLIFGSIPTSMNRNCCNCFHWYRSPPEDDGVNALPQQLSPSPGVNIAPERPQDTIQYGVLRISSAATSHSFVPGLNYLQWRHFSMSGASLGQQYHFERSSSILRRVIDAGLQQIVAFTPTTKMFMYLNILHGNRDAYFEQEMDSRKLFWCNGDISPLLCCELIVLKRRYPQGKVQEDVLSRARCIWGQDILLQKVTS